MPPRNTRTTRSRVAAEPVVAPVVSVPREKSLWPVVVIMGMLLAAALSVAGYFYYQYRHSAEVVDAKEIEDLSKEIGAIMMLPDNETPTLATVTDKDKLSEQPFFQKSENGDKVLIYSQSGRAILYRPSLKKIVDVTTVNVNQPATTAPEVTPQTPAPQPVAETVPSVVRVALYNGSKTVGITATKEKQLSASFSNVAVVTKDTAKKNDYAETIVIDITGKNADMAARIAGTMNGKVGSLPDGEVAPTDADILVVVAGE